MHFADRHFLSILSISVNISVDISLGERKTVFRGTKVQLYEKQKYHYCKIVLIRKNEKKKTISLRNRAILHSVNYHTYYNIQDFVLNSV